MQKSTILCLTWKFICPTTQQKGLHDSPFGCGHETGWYRMRGLACKVIYTWQKIMRTSFQIKVSWKFQSGSLRCRNRFSPRLLFDSWPKLGSPLCPQLKERRHTEIADPSNETSCDPHLFRSFPVQFVTCVSVLSWRITTSQTLAGDRTHATLDHTSVKPFQHLMMILHTWDCKVNWQRPKDWPPKYHGIMLIFPYAQDTLHRVKVHCRLKWGFHTCQLRMRPEESFDANLFLLWRQIVLTCLKR